jgi:hypothetical protein
MAPLVRMVLHGDEVQADRVGESGELERKLARLRVRGDERAELEFLLVVGHRPTLPGDGRPAAYIGQAKAA